MTVTQSNATIISAAARYAERGPSCRPSVAGISGGAGRRCRTIQVVFSPASQTGFRRMASTLLCYRSRVMSTAVEPGARGLHGGRTILG